MTTQDAEQWLQRAVAYESQAAYDEAVEARLNAISVYRELAAEEPSAYRGELARVLDELARLPDDYYVPNRLAAVEEAVAIYRELTADRPALFEAELAASLGRLSEAVGSKRTYAEARALSGEMVVRFRALAAKDPAVYLPRLAEALRVYRIHEVMVGGYSATYFAAEREIIDIYRGLSITRPREFRPELMGALNECSLGLAEANRNREAVTAGQEAVAIARESAASEPEDPDARWTLAVMLGNLSEALAGLGLAEEALRAAEENLAIVRDLCAQSSNRYRNALALCLTRFSRRATAAGQTGTARDAILEGITIHRERIGDLSTYTGGLAEALSQLSAVEASDGQYRQALDASIESISLDRSQFERLGAIASGDELVAGLLQYISVLNRLGHDLESTELLAEVREVAAATRSARAPEAG
jgi:tetratricopeptide (TPR) repeat protein